MPRMLETGQTGRRTWARCGIAVAVGLLLAVAAGCTYRGGGDNPLVRKATWFSYLNGDDIRAACYPGAPARYRFVYNGIYVRQVRTYDIVAGAAAGGRHEMEARVIGPTDVSRIVIGTSGIFAALGDLLSPGRGVIERTVLSDRDLDDLDTALLVSGFFDPPPVGERLTAEDFWWTGVACIDGRIVFNAYKWPSSRFDRATFPPLLISWDPIAIPVEQPRPLSLLDIYSDETIRQNQRPTFGLTVGRDGFAHLP
jgi:hypothetical protein